MLSTSFMMLLCLRSGWLVHAAGAQAEGATPLAPKPRKAMARKVGGHSQKSSVEVQADGLAVASKRNSQMAREATSKHASLAKGTQVKSGGKVDNSHVHQRAAENATAVQSPEWTKTSLQPACIQAVEAVPECANLTPVFQCLGGDDDLSSPRRNRLCAALMTVLPAPCRHPEIEEQCAVAEPFAPENTKLVFFACVEQMHLVPACEASLRSEALAATCGEHEFLEMFAESTPEECKIFRHGPAECQTEEIKMACAAAKKYMEFVEGCVAAIQAEPACEAHPEHKKCHPEHPFSSVDFPLECPAPCQTEGIKDACMAEDTFAEMGSAQSYSMALAPLLVYFLL